MDPSVDSNTGILYRLPVYTVQAPGIYPVSLLVSTTCIRYLEYHHDRKRVTSLHGQHVRTTSLSPTSPVFCCVLILIVEMKEFIQLITLHARNTEIVLRSMIPHCFPIFT
jgi:hypothetical protein